MNKRKPAVLVVSYGCSYAEAREKTLNRIEEDIQAAYPEAFICRAWTSRMLRRRLLERDGIWISGVEEAMEELLAQGIREVVVQPVHVLDGLENRTMAEEILSFADRFSQIVIGAPLLGSDEDKKRVVRVTAEEIQIEDGEALVLAGHGTKTSADEVYQELNQMFQEEGYENIFLGTMEGRLDFEYVLRCIRRRRPKRIVLAPLLITAGKHAVRDLCGEQESSWESRFEAAGFPVECVLKGLGEYEEIRRIFVEHVEDSMKIYEKAQGAVITAEQ